MKTFLHERGHVAGQTMTVSELRELLTKYQDDMPVLAEWEGVLAYIEPDNFAVESVFKGNMNDIFGCLVIDVNKY